jgi:hypothetical protein
MTAKPKNKLEPSSIPSSGSKKCRGRAPGSRSCWSTKPWTWRCSRGCRRENGKHGAATRGGQDGRGSPRGQQATDLLHPRSTLFRAMLPAPDRARRMRHLGGAIRQRRTAPGLPHGGRETTAGGLEGEPQTHAPAPKPRRASTAARRACRLKATHRNHLWNYDVIFDQTSDGRRLKWLPWSMSSAIKLWGNLRGTQFCAEVDLGSTYAQSYHQTPNQRQTTISRSSDLICPLSCLRGQATTSKRSFHSSR